jgi:phosphatidate cytidylyltransferase
VLRRRFGTAAVLAPIVVGAIVAGGPWVVALILLVTARASYELARALTLPYPAAFGAGALPVLLAVPFGTTGILAGVMLGLPWALFWLAGYPEARTLRAMLALMLMATWVGAPLAHVYLIGDQTNAVEGVYLVLVAVAGPWVSDSGAYFAGVLFGRHPLFPSLSPKKTIEGSIGGIVLTTAVIAPLANLFLGLPLWTSALAGVVVSVVSQAGDLFESILKRLLGLKDLGRALPGHGGILDRIDSLLFTAPAVYYLYTLFLT